MELRSFLAGILFLYGIQTLLPFFGIMVAVTMPSPWLNLAAAIIALVLSYYLFRN
jgi:divalent metal cation (Fe/Co/Zn/Cd) transporter